MYYLHSKERILTHSSWESHVHTFRNENNVYETYPANSDMVAPVPTHKQFKVVTTYIGVIGEDQIADNTFLSGS